MITIKLTLCVNIFEKQTLGFSTVCCFFCGNNMYGIDSPSMTKDTSLQILQKLLFITFHSDICSYVSQM